jgi:hypothetical protein
MIRRSGLLFCSILCALLAEAQLNNSFISDRIEMNDPDTNTFGIHVQEFNYMRNTEYFNNIELGRTLFGYQLNPVFYTQ